MWIYKGLVHWGCFILKKIKIRKTWLVNDTDWTPTFPMSTNHWSQLCNTVQRSLSTDAEEGSVWLVRRGGCFRIPRGAVSRSCEFEDAGGSGPFASVEKSSSVRLSRGIRAADTRGDAMPHMLISTQIRLVRKPPASPRATLAAGGGRALGAGDSGIYLLLLLIIRVDHCRL